MALSKIGQKLNQEEKKSVRVPRVIYYKSRAGSKSTQDRSTHWI